MDVSTYFWGELEIKPIGLLCSIATFMITLKRARVATLFFLTLISLTACSSDESSNSNEDDTPQTYSFSELQTLASNEPAKAIRIIRKKSEVRGASVDELTLLADLYIDQVNGSAALGALDLAETLGATRGRLALQRAGAMMLLGRFDEAEEELKLVDLSGRNGIRAMIMQAEIAAAQGSPDTARRRFQFARDIDPNNARIESGLAILELTLGNYEEAIAQANAAIAKAPQSDDPKPYYVKGSAARYQQKPKQAIEFYEKALERKPNDLFTILDLIGAHLDNGDLDAAETVLDALLASNSRNNLAKFYAAYIAAERGDSRTAEDILLQATDLINTYPPAKRLFGHVAYDLQKYDTASAYLEDYLTTAPADGETRLKLAESKTNTGNAEEAMEILAPALPSNEMISELLSTEAAPEDLSPAVLGPAIESIARAADAQMAQGHLEDARTRYANAVALAKKLNPADPELVRSLSAILATAEFATGHDSEGLERMQQATHSDQATSQELTTLANMQMTAGHYDAALSTAERMKANSDTALLGYNIEGAVAHRRNDYKTAIAAFTKALQANPDYSSALKNRAASYIADRQYELARTDLLKLRDQADGDGQYFGMLGRVQLELKNYVAAIDAYRIARDLIPQSGLFAANHASALKAKGRIDEAIEATKTALHLLPEGSSVQMQVKTMLDELLKAKEDAETFVS